MATIVNLILAVLALVGLAQAPAEETPPATSSPPSSTPGPVVQATDTGDFGLSDGGLEAPLAAQPMAEDYVPPATTTTTTVVYGDGWDSVRGGDMPDDPAGTITFHTGDGVVTTDRASVGLGPDDPIPWETVPTTTTPPPVEAWCIVTDETGGLTEEPCP